MQGWASQDLCPFECFPPVHVGAILQLTISSLSRGLWSWTCSITSVYVKKSNSYIISYNVSMVLHLAQESQIISLASRAANRLHWWLVGWEMQCCRMQKLCCHEGEQSFLPTGKWENVGEEERNFFKLLKQK